MGGRQEVHLKLNSTKEEAGNGPNSPSPFGSGACCPQGVLPTAASRETLRRSPLGREPVLPVTTHFLSSVSFLGAYTVAFPPSFTSQRFYFHYTMWGRGIECTFPSPEKHLFCNFSLEEARDTLIEMWCPAFKERTIWLGR